MSDNAPDPCNTSPVPPNLPPPSVAESRLRTMDRYLPVIQAATVGFTVGFAAALLLIALALS